MKNLFRKREKKLPVSFVADKALVDNMDREADKRGVSRADIIRETLTQRWG